ncbi:sigma 54-interacting transcriptional regulator [Massilia sp. BJB1822]|uniref:sigma 54-interacting transcriptional regulator n=1 Tax=Massilia sp. BJB1822 TaxID=2744470 RepID=UPI001594525A|nr:sigma 54-interacting transcriptional regulator [Massilia sp. BJB1822]NVD97744.1 sigma-54-dependent Fis family transcriptional regulator [Massilia sp. BJB1822]
MALSVWIHLADRSCAAVGAALHQALIEVDIAPTDRPDHHEGIGILIFGHFLPTLTDQIRKASLQVTLLVICCSPVSLPPDVMWALLQAGATDLLLWPDGHCYREQVTARLLRWDAVQSIMKSPAVQGILVGESLAWRRMMRDVVEVAAFSRSPVLITGETGTGKDLIAKMVHRLSGHQKPLTVLDCTTLSPELAGSEFFGHERGAFTGAVTTRDGAFAEANDSVLFLDEIGELSLPLQAQLLRVIQEQQFKRIGSNTWYPTQFRLVCATNRNLEEEVARGTFRADLYYRIAGWRCRTPPLRERSSDILPLAHHFLRLLASDDPYPSLDPAVRQYLMTRSYPGNVRDLRQTVARIWHRHTGPGPITIGDIPPDERLYSTPAWPDACFVDAIRHALDLGVPLLRIGQAASDTAFRLTLDQEQNNNQRAAKRLDVSDRAVQQWRKAHDCTTN